MLTGYRRAGRFHASGRALASSIIRGMLFLNWMRAGSFLDGGKSFMSERRPMESTMARLKAITKGCAFTEYIGPSVGRPIGLPFLSFVNEVIVFHEVME